MQKHAALDKIVKQFYINVVFNMEKQVLVYGRR